MKESLTLPSGRELQLGIAPFAVGMKLVKTLAAEAKNVDVELESLDLSKLAGKNLNSIKNLVLQMLSSDALEAALFQCMERCLLDGQKITRQTFEPEDMRQDFFPVAWEVIAFNVAPFAKSLGLSSSNTQAETQGQSPV